MNVGSTPPAASRTRSKLVPPKFGKCAATPYGPSMLSVTLTSGDRRLASLARVLVIGPSICRAIGVSTPASSHTEPTVKGLEMNSKQRYDNDKGFWVGRDVGGILKYACEAGCALKFLSFSGRILTTTLMRSVSGTTSMIAELLTMQNLRTTRSATKTNRHSAMKILPCGAWNQMIGGMAKATRRCVMKKTL